MPHLDVPPWAWIAFNAYVVGLLLLDLYGFNKKAHDTISPGPGVYALNPSVGDQTLSTKRSAGRVTFNMGKRHLHKGG